MLLCGILKLFCQYMNHGLFEYGIFNGEHYLHPAFQITGHPVGAGQIHLRIAVVFKYEYAAVFQIITNYGINPYIIAHAGYACL